MGSFKQLHAEDSNLHARVLELKAMAEQLDQVAELSPTPNDSSEPFKDRLRDCAGDMLFFMTEHFFHEEEAMKQIDPIVESSSFRAHSSDHAELSEKALDLLVEITEAHSGALAASLASNLLSKLEFHYQHFDKHITA